MAFDVGILHAGSPRSFEAQGHRSKFKVTLRGKQVLSDCWGGRPRLKSRPELETVNINSQPKIF